MAEYYPLISRAVAGLRNGTPEARQAIYDRAKQALIGQLRAMEPPVPEEDIARETVALDDAIARVEADVAPKAAVPKAAIPPARDRSPPSIKPPPVSSQPPPVRPERPAIGSAPSLGGVQRTEGSDVAPRTTLPPLRPPPLRPAKAPPAKEDAAVERANEPERAAEPALLAVSATPPVEPATLPAAPVLRLPSSADVEPSKGPALRPSDPEPEASGDNDQAEPLATRPTDDGVRPAAPRPVEKQRPDFRVFIVAFAALAAVIAVAFTAWKLRDRPEELARVPTITRPAEQPAQKIVERADNPGGAGGGASDAVVVNDTQPSPAPAATAPSTTAQPAPAPAVQADAQQALSSGAASPTPVVADPAVPVAYKAAILVDAPEEPQKVKTYVGTIVWRTETVNPGQDQPVGTAIHGEADIPDAKVKLTFDMKKTNDPQFPASHTIELKFTEPADSPIGSIKQVSVPQMRREDMPTGEPLSGVPVTITDNYFLVGLTRGGATEDQNLGLIQSRNWFDVPMLLANGRAAKITFEKGATGERIFDDVLKGWKSASN